VNVKWYLQYEPWRQILCFKSFPREEPNLTILFIFANDRSVPWMRMMSVMTSGVRASWFTARTFSTLTIATPHWKGTSLWWHSSAWTGYRFVNILHQLEAISQYLLLNPNAAIDFLRCSDKKLIIGLGGMYRCWPCCRRYMMLF